MIYEIWIELSEKLFENFNFHLNIKYWKMEK